MITFRLFLDKIKSNQNDSNIKAVGVLKIPLLWYTFDRGWKNIIGIVLGVV